MAAFFFDSSGIVKRYVNEIGTAWVNAIIDPAAGNQIYVARITGVEVVAALTRRQRSGTISLVAGGHAIARFRQELIAEYRIVEITPTVLTQAMDLAETRGLRGYDAVQLAGILDVNSQRIVQGMPALTLVSADLELNAAAAAEGLAVEDPNTHP